jgi:hypothetical protein
LRAVRFAGRFGFRVDNDLRAAASHPAVAKDLQDKVSRERFGIEVNKMLSGMVCIICLRSHSHSHLRGPVRARRPSYASHSVYCISLEQKSAVASFELIAAFGLRHIVFAAPKFSTIDFEPAVIERLAAAATSYEQKLHPIADESKSENKATTALAIQNMRLAQSFADKVQTHKSDERRILLLAAFLSPYYGYR